MFLYKEHPLYIILKSTKIHIIIGAPKLRQQYLTFSFGSPLSYRSSNFVVVKVVALKLFASYFFCIAPHIVITIPTIVEQWLSLFHALKAIAKTKGKLYAIAFKINKEQQQQQSQYLEEKLL